MPVGPGDEAGGPIEVVVKADGSIVDNTGLVAVDIEHRVNRIARAVLVYDDGAQGFRDFPLTDAATFEPGTQIDVEAGYGGGPKTEVFTGVVVAERLTIGDGGEVRLRVECRHRAVAMTLTRRNAVRRDVKDSEVIRTLFAAANLACSVSATEAMLREVVQHDATDWDFAVTRAEANGLVVLAQAADVRIVAPDATQEPVLRVTYGLDLIRFEGLVDARDQQPNAVAVTWSPAEQTLSQRNAAALPLARSGPGNLSPKQLADALAQEDVRLQSAALDLASLEPWAKGRQLRAALSANRARLVFAGSGRAAIGDTIELHNLGNRFGGRAFVGAVMHRIEAGEWLTTVETGLDVLTHSDLHRLTSPAAAGLTAPIQGLQLGVVQKLEDDPDGQHRVMVSLPLLGDDQPGVWARLAQAYASNGFGAFVLPEIGDEVVLGFFDDDPSAPVVLASLYSANRPPPFSFEDANDTKALVTRTEMKVTFDEAKKVITVTTPAGNRAILDDEQKTVTLKDETGNVVELSPRGIKLSSPGDITLEAKGNIEATAQMDATVKGLNVTADAQVGVTAKGGASAELSAAGNTTVKGAMVMIN
ncbi:MAG: type VI secretion system tip protein VgrG [Geminicoccaceae bacterium]|nr:MAG: type VI secretion system tip protein VgrG [Geminicoccaceae bacterium]